jgi:hypothetical protein
MKWMLSFVMTGVSMFLLLFVLYNISGYRHYNRVNKVINNLPTEQAKLRAWEIFENKDGGNYSGIYAGVVLGKVGVWGIPRIPCFEF